MSVNLSDKIGIVPTFEAELNKIAAKDALFRRRFKRIEVIPGAESGFTPVQTYIRLPQLLATYHPHLVLLQQSYSAFALQQTFDHFSSERIDPKTGLSEAIGLPQHFWPIPRSMNGYLWRLERANELRVKVLGLRLALLKWRLRFFGGKDSEYVRIHKAYLDGIRDRSKAAGAEFMSLNVERLGDGIERRFYESMKGNTWYKPEWVATKFASWPHARDVDGPPLEAYMKEKLNTVSMAEALWKGWKPEYNLPGDLHPSVPGMEHIGRVSASQAYPMINKLLLEKR